MMSKCVKKRMMMWYELKCEDRPRRKVAMWAVICVKAQF